MIENPRNRMIRASILASSLAFSALACAPAPDLDGAGESHRAAETPARNVLLITLDTTRHDILGAYGEAGGYTPVVDSVAERGLVFDRAYSTASFTGPAHASILTGQVPSAHGIIYNGHRVKAAINSDSMSVAEHLAAQGFATGAVVSNGVLHSRYGFARGFASYHFHRDPQPGDQGGSAAGVREHAVGWLDQVGEQRFFLWVHFIEPHLPYGVSEEVQERFGLEEREVPIQRAKALPTDRVRRIYGADLYEADRELGVLLARLDELGLRDETLIVITSDHGEYLHEHGLVDHSLLYEPLLHVPLIVAGPGIAAGSRHSELVSVIDVPELITEALGVPPLPTSQGTHPSAKTRGRAGRHAVFAEWRHYRLLLDPDAADPRMDFLVSAQVGSQKLILPVLSPDRRYLFDLERDPTETTDYAALETTVAAGLAERHRLHVTEDLSSGLLGVEEVEIDDEALKMLKALGYVE